MFKNGKRLLKIILGVLVVLFSLLFGFDIYQNQSELSGVGENEELQVVEVEVEEVIDGTFANYKISYSNVERSIKKNRIAAIFYIYQDPLIAWDFTKKREKLEGRHVPKEVFIKSFFNAKENMKKIKADFKDKIQIFLIKKNYSNRVEKTWFNIEDIDNHLRMEYTIKSLRLKL
ncbi:zeta toxin family protein [Candidatus Parcubacteria bacterium]|nr:zeta toxin family protein [Candidatus Parcubacteria bacterium]